MEMRYPIKLPLTVEHWRSAGIGTCQPGQCRNKVNDFLSYPQCLPGSVQPITEAELRLTAQNVVVSQHFANALVIRRFGLIFSSVNPIITFFFIMEQCAFKFFGIDNYTVKIFTVVPNKKDRT